MGIEQQRPHTRRPAPEKVVVPTSKEQTSTQDDREMATAAIAEMRRTARRFDELLVQYGALLKESESVERTLDQNMRTLEAAKAVETAKARAAELGMALLKNATSAALIGGSAGIASASMGADPLTTAIAAASGALAGVVAEQAMQSAEFRADASEVYYTRHPRTAQYMADKNKEKTAPQELENASSIYAELQRQLTTISNDIDGLQNVYPQLDTGASAGSTEKTASYESMRQKIETLKHFGVQLDDLLIQYHLAVQVTNSITDDVQRAEQQVRHRETQIAAGVAVRQIIEVTKHLLQQGGVATILGMGAYLYNGIYQVGLQTAPLVGSAALAGIGIQYFLDRFEKKVGQRNLPHGIYEQAAALEGDAGYQKYTDVALQEHRDFLQGIQSLRHEMQLLENNLSTNIDSLLSSRSS